MNKIEVGDLVELKSGSMKMTVSKIYNDDTVVNVIYCVNNIIFREEGLYSNTLKKI